MNDTREIFVFGSNLAGRHGKGAALHARKHHGAIYGQGSGLQGQSYGLPTMDGRLKPLPLTEIAKHAAEFLRVAERTPNLQYRLTPVGCGLAGFTPEQIAPLFEGAPPNVLMPDEFLHVLKSSGPKAARPARKSSDLEGIEKLRPINYTYLFPVSDKNGRSSARRKGDLSDLFRHANGYLLAGRFIPPLRIINLFLAKGRSDLGMGGGAEWQPFALSEDEYFSLVRYLDTPAGRGKFFRKVQAEVAEPPDDVRTEEEYRTWETRKLMEEPSHHFNTTKVRATVSGVVKVMTLGESILAGADLVQYIYPGPDA